MTHRDLPRFANLRDGGNLPDAANLDRAVIPALRVMRNACVIAFVALMAVLVANKALPQAAYDQVNHEVIR